MTRYLAIIWRGRWQKFVTLLLRRPIKSFAQAVIDRAYEMQIINVHQLREIGRIIDRSLYAEYYKSAWVDERGESAPPPINPQQ